jgi:hypothetical protein
VATFTGNKPKAPFNRQSKPKAEPKIIHQTFFKSVGPRTYAAQIKEIANGNHLLVRKTRLFVYAEDFPELFKMLDDAKAFIESHPVSKAAQAKRQKFWERQNLAEKSNPKTVTGAPTAEEPPENDSEGELDA